MYSILDIETTGGKFNEEAITEIAIHRFDGHRVVDSFISLVNPERDIQPYVQKLTGISPGMVRTAPKFYQLAKRIVEITEGSVLVAHNAQFDYRILRTEFRRLGYEFERKTLCTVDLSKRLIPEAESHSLGKLVKSLGIPVSNRHRANGDALATLKLFQVLLNRDTEKEILREVIRTEKYGELSSRQLRLVESLPPDTGVYYLFNRDEELIYLGSSPDMRAAVNRHFTRQDRLARCLRKETREVQFERTGGELMARLKAFVETLGNAPLHNKPPKSKRKTSPGEILVNGISYRLEDRHLLLVDRGRNSGERSAIWLQGAQVRGMGYYSLNHQINNIHILETLLTPLEHFEGALEVVSTYTEEKPILKAIEL
ncbi:MAG: ribonuclease H-like domain-containing protein [Flavobacteriaceae bacterium]|jgi:DNA polymerase-3 subunit epsilon|nr:MAG: ribonuclease H-like domain-containing protein [Flavobacteriaceae bacterium]